MKWRIKKEFEQGNIWGGADNYGYKVKNKVYTIVPEQAEVVRRIFDMYINGMGMTLIAKTLNDEGIKPLQRERWSKNSIMNILLNISYTGDLLLQKTYSENYMTKKTKMNKGNLPQYYVEEHHEPIIDKKTFELAAKIRDTRANKYKVRDSYTGETYVFTHKIKCSCCGAYYRHKIVSGRSLWICSTFNTKGKSYCQKSKQIPEAKLYEAINAYFGVSTFDEKKFSKVDYLEAKEDNIISIHLLNGEVDEVKWIDHSRSASWTPEMKEKARLRTIETNKKRKEQKLWEK